MNVTRCTVVLRNSRGRHTANLLLPDIVNVITEPDVTAGGVHHITMFRKKQ